MHVVKYPVRRSRRRMYLPSERMVVNGVGLGELDGMFNIGKMFTRMFTFTPSSFKLKNIVGAIGSVATTVATGGIANIASEIAGPSGLKLTKGTITGAHSKVMEIAGYGTLAVAAVAGGAALLPAGALTGGATAAAAGSGGIGTASAGSSVIGAATGQVAATAGGGILSTIGSGLSAVGSGLMSILPTALTSILPAMMGGGGGGMPQGGMTQAEYDAQVRAQQEAQAAYDAQVRAQQNQMYIPGMVQDTSYMGVPPVDSSINTSYGDLRTPYTAITEDGETVQIDPATGQIIPSGLSVPAMVGIGGALLLAGWYLMPSSKSTN